MKKQKGKYKFTLIVEKRDNVNFLRILPWIVFADTYLKALTKGVPISDAERITIIKEERLDNEKI